MDTDSTDRMLMEDVWLPMAETVMPLTSAPNANGLPSAPRSALAEPMDASRVMPSAPMPAETMSSSVDAVTDVVTPSATAV